MKKNKGLSIILSSIALLLLGAGYTVPARMPTAKKFSIGSNYGARTTFDFSVKEAGCIWARATWNGTAETLSLILNGPDYKKAYDRQDGTSGLVVAHSVSSADLKSGTGWSITVANFSGGRARGIIAIEIPPAYVPCEVAATPAPSAGQVALSWRYTGRELPAVFLVERSTDNQTWRLVSGCKRSPARSLTSYNCLDSGLLSTAFYTYRVCSALSPSTTRCGPADVSPPVSVRAP